MCSLLLLSRTVFESIPDSHLLFVCVFVLFMWNQLCTIIKLNWKQASAPKPAFAVRKECRPSCLQHGHTVYCQTCRTVLNSPLERLVLHLPSDAAVLSRLFSFSLFFPLFFSFHLFEASEDGQVVSSSCVTSCLVSWCACSCQYLCLLWIACFSPWLDTNVAHKLLLTLVWTNVGDPYKVIKGTK